MKRVVVCKLHCSLDPDARRRVGFCPNPALLRQTRRHACGRHRYALRLQPRSQRGVQRRGAPVLSDLRRRFADSKRRGRGPQSAHHPGHPADARQSGQSRARNPAAMRPAVPVLRGPMPRRPGLRRLLPVRAFRLRHRRPGSVRRHSLVGPERQRLSGRRPLAPPRWGRKPQAPGRRSAEGIPSGAIFGCPGRA